MLPMGSQDACRSRLSLQLGFSRRGASSLRMPGGESRPPKGLLVPLVRPWRHLRIGAIPTISGPWVPSDCQRSPRLPGDRLGSGVRLGARTRPHLLFAHLLRTSSAHWRVSGSSWSHRRWLIVSMIACSSSLRFMPDLEQEPCRSRCFLL